MQAEFPMATATAERQDCHRLHRGSPVRPDEELLATYAQTGNRDAFEELVHRYERELYGYLCQCLGDAQWAEDAFQTTFLQVHLKCRQFVPGRRLRPWLYTIAAHQAVDLLRRNRRHKAVSLSTAAGDDGTDSEGRSLGGRLETEEPDPSERLRLIEDRQWTRSALKRIPAKVRQVLILVVYKGLPYREAADVLGIPLGTVKSRMNRALRNLHQALIATKHSVSTDNRRCSVS
jgi:RNA polymerase sigma-70 factor, ECF subfamily